MSKMGYVKAKSKYKLGGILKGTGENKIHMKDMT